MSETAWGMCAAFGCPLLGTQGNGDGAWFCFCHIGRSTKANDEITHALRTQWADVVDMTLALRRDRTQRGDGAAMRAAYAAMREAGRTDLMFRKDVDGGRFAWLMRLERALIEATSDRSTQAQMFSAQAGEVIGPTSGERHHSDNEREEESA